MKRRRRGIIVSEAIMGLLILAILATILATLSYRHARVCDRLAASRSAVRAAEAALTRMQSGEAPAGSITVRPIDGDSGVARQVWVEVTADHEGARATLVGLVPTTALPPEAGR